MQADFQTRLDRCMRLEDENRILQVFVFHHECVDVTTISRCRIIAMPLTDLM
jgi:hypothetical protein